MHEDWWVQGVLALLWAVLGDRHLTVARPWENHFWLQPDGLVAAQRGRRRCIGQRDQVLACVSLGPRKIPKRNGETNFLVCLKLELVVWLAPQNFILSPPKCWAKWWGGWTVLVFCKLEKSFHYAKPSKQVLALPFVLLQLLTTLHWHETCILLIF